MARPSLSDRLVAQATQALVAGIEIYNKPVFSYRENAFAILATNAWELLLKARVVSIAGNRSTALYVYEQRRSTAGAKTKKLYIRRNRSGNPMTIGLHEAIDIVAAANAADMASEVRQNLNAIVEIRDNAIHYMNPGPALAQQVLEIGAATISNFVTLGQKWFQIDLTPYKLHLLPLGFIGPPPGTPTTRLSLEEKNLLLYLSGLVQGSSQGTTASSGLYTALEVKLSLLKSAGAGAVQAIRVGQGTSGSIPVHLTEADIRHHWPWTYKELTKRLKGRYSDFKANADYHRRRQTLESGPHAKIRFLDPKNQKSSRQIFYSSSILSEFDRHYTLR